MSLFFPADHMERMQTEVAEKKTVVFGASLNPERYSNRAVRKLQAYGHPVTAIGRREGSIEGIPILTNKPDLQDVDTVTLYLNPKNQEPYYEYILSLHPKRIIFNPGAENDVLASMAARAGIETIEACTLVLLSTKQY